MKAGIYEIVNTINQKRYIGSSVNLYRRWQKHAWELNRKEHRNKHMQAAWSHYGSGAFKFRTILICARKHLIDYEQRCLDGLKPEYNVAPTAGAAPYGMVVSEATRAKISANRIGHKVSAETRQKISAACLGYKHTDDAKVKIAAAVRGRIASLETRAKMSFNAKNRSEETRKKLSLSKIGHLVSAEARAKISASKVGKKLTIEHVAKASLAHKGLKRSDETKKKMSIARKKWWESR